MTEKSFEDMTQEERIQYWNDKSEEEKIKRSDSVDGLQPEQKESLRELYKTLDTVLDTALYPDMGGIKMVTAYELQELSDAFETFQFQFNMRGH
jgi:hypothetical protein